MRQGISKQMAQLTIREKKKEKEDEGRGTEGQGKDKERSKLKKYLPCVRSLRAVL